MTWRDDVVTPAFRCGTDAEKAFSISAAGLRPGAMLRRPRGSRLAPDLAPTRAGDARAPGRTRPEGGTARDAGTGDGLDPGVGPDRALPAPAADAGDRRHRAHPHAERLGRRRVRRDPAGPPAQRGRAA